MRVCLKSRGCLLGQPKRILQVREALRILALLTDERRLTAADHTKVMEGFYELACELGCVFREAVPRGQKSPGWIDVPDGMSLDAAVMSEQYLLHRTRLLRQEILFRFATKRSIQRTFDGTLARGKQVRLLYRYRLLWAVGETFGVFMKAKLDTENPVRPQNDETEEITDVEFCCFELAGLIKGHG
jgi:hypothetical protein